MGYMALIAIVASCSAGGHQGNGDTFESGPEYVGRKGAARERTARERTAEADTHQSLRYYS